CQARGQSRQASASIPLGYAVGVLNLRLHGWSPCLGMVRNSKLGLMPIARRRVDEPAEIDDIADLYYGPACLGDSGNERGDILVMAGSNTVRQGLQGGLEGKGSSFG